MGQFLHVFSLNELVDISKIYAKAAKSMSTLRLVNASWEDAKMHSA